MEQVNTRKFLRDFWNGEGKTVYSVYASSPEYRQVEDEDKLISNAVENLKRCCNLPGYNVPRFMPDFGTISTASYWGGKVYKPLGGRTGIKPVVKYIEDIKRISPADTNQGHTKRAFSLWEKVAYELNDDKLPCSFFDIQGPLNTAALLCNQEDFMVWMYKNPRAVHELLDKITENIISIYKSMIKIIPTLEAPLWPYIWLPLDIGIGITADYMPLLSPELYKEFGLPYLKRIAQEFNGVFIHCCGEFTHQIDNLAKSDINIIGIEFAYPHVDIKKLFNAFGSSAVFVPNKSTLGDGKMPDTCEYFKYINHIRLKETRLWYLLRDTEDTYDQQVKLMDNIMGKW